MRNRNIKTDDCGVMGGRLSGASDSRVIPSSLIRRLEGLCSPRRLGCRWFDLIIVVWVGAGVALELFTLEFFLRSRLVSTLSKLSLTRTLPSGSVRRLITAVREQSRC